MGRQNIIPTRAEIARQARLNARRNGAVRLWRVPDLSDPRGVLKAAMVVAALALMGVQVVPDAALAVAGSQSGPGCRAVSVVDGDTVRLWCPGRGLERARLMGFDTPEVFSPQCAGELAAGLRATRALRRMLREAGQVTWVREGTDRYGRVLVRGFVDGAPVAGAMIAGGHARSYAGGQRQGWCGRSA